jgi:hypothetical protein
MNRREYIKNTALFLGYAVSASALTETFIACKNEAQANLAWKPVFLSNNQANTIAEITETILPKTATPGAKEIGVPQFIDKLLKDILSEADKTTFLAGLKDFEVTCEKVQGKSFTACTQAEKEAYLLKMDKESGKTPPSAWGITLVPNPPKPTFFKQIKDLTLFGYFTSEKVGKELLAYDPIPGPFIGCMPLGNNNVWSGE